MSSGRKVRADCEEVNTTIHHDLGWAYERGLFAQVINCFFPNSICNSRTLLHISIE